MARVPPRRNSAPKRTARDEADSYTTVPAPSTASAKQYPWGKSALLVSTTSSGNLSVSLQDGVGFTLTIEAPRRDVRMSFSGGRTAYLYMGSSHGSMPAEIAHRIAEDFGLGQLGRTILPPPALAASLSPDAPDLAAGTPATKSPSVASDAGLTSAPDSASAAGAETSVHNLEERF